MKMRRPVGTTWVPFVPSPTTPLDSGFRRNDERGAELASAGGVGRGHPQGRLRPFSYQSHMPTGADTPKYEKPKVGPGSENRPEGICPSPPRPQRGTSPSPCGVCERSTFQPAPRPSGLPPAIGGYGTYLRGNDERGVGTTSAGAVECVHTKGRVTSFSYE